MNYRQLKVNGGDVYKQTQDLTTHVLFWGGAGVDQGQNYHVTQNSPLIAWSKPRQRGWNNSCNLMPCVIHLCSIPIHVCDICQDLSQKHRAQNDTVSAMTSYMAMATQGTQPPIARPYSVCWGASLTCFRLKRCCEISQSSPQTPDISWHFHIRRFPESWWYLQIIYF